VNAHNVINTSILCGPAGSLLPGIRELPVSQITPDHSIQTPLDDNVRTTVAHPGREIGTRQIGTGRPIEIRGLELETTLKS
jgi:hypothetical protein